MLGSRVLVATALPRQSLNRGPQGMVADIDSLRQYMVRVHHPTPTAGTLFSLSTQCYHFFFSSPCTCPHWGAFQYSDDPSVHLTSSSCSVSALPKALQVMYIQQNLHDDARPAERRGQEPILHLSVDGAQIREW